MKRYILLLLATFMTGCITKDDALYAPWNHINESNDSSIGNNIEKVVHNRYKNTSEEPEYCVTRLTYPHRQTCTKESDL